ncbi:anhydro-N-acetylmuramic acid kinase [Pelomonas sp. CA6]|uniref:anhydro-N-acetylmuramic acid kinase n=1 Tax=Pelomonas sp. CA6 TaxID=2907999 RepID=UPI001F4C4785|nr:anhydro-N-acetylmuramic acid kinase [Pelomonas sp. CA6]MCH7343255.1 anhydro-N-acetylmuramic acid kinase [Pelomonas sp. CA6]
MRELYLGLMSGTSLDGVDAVLMELSDGTTPHPLGHRFLPFPEALRAELMALNDSGGHDELQRAALAANGVARCYATLSLTLLEQLAIRPAQVRAIGAHGQTVRHRPGAFDGTGFSLQLLNAPLLAELTGIGVVHDLRSRDLAAGGQGAPLVPAFHRAMLGRPDANIAVLNVGGISNLSLLRADGDTRGFDCGPGNCLMDLWASRHLGQPYDADGRWAAQGQVLPKLLQSFLSEPYFQQAPPRSTGRDLFNAAWLDRHQADHAADAHPVDVQATLLALSAHCVADSLRRWGQGNYEELLVCGGGSLNGRLMQELQAQLPVSRVMSTDSRGIPAMQMEAAAFAWLAMRWLHQLPGNLPAVTGARGHRVLGSFSPA